MDASKTCLVPAMQLAGSPACLGAPPAHLPPLPPPCREPSLPEEYVPELRAAAERAGLDWDQLARTDNSCGPHPTAEQLAAEGRRLLAQDVARLEEDVEQVGVGGVGAGFPTPACWRTMWSGWLGWVLGADVGLGGTGGA